MRTQYYWLRLLLCAAGLAWFEGVAAAVEATIVVEASGAKLTLSGARAERFEGNFAVVHLDAVLQGKGGDRKGSLTLVGVPQSNPTARAGILFGPKLLELKIDGLPDFMVKELKVAAALRLAKGVELGNEALMGPLYVPEPLFPQAARGLLRLWPRVEVRTTPAILVYLDGDPLMATVPGTQLQYVVNTDWDLFFHQGVYNHFLRVGKLWYEAYSASGPWIPLRAELPKDFAAIPDAHPRAHVRKLLAKPVKDPPPLEIVVATEPTELVLFDGEPKWVPIPGTVFSYGENTAADVFSAKDGVVLLASGRWFAARSLGGPWEGLGTDVPLDLAKIPKDHPKAHVRALVPGTDEAKAALVSANTAIVATVRRDLALQVELLGPPQLVPVQGQLSYVKNTVEDMLAIGDRYYCCRNGVWFAANEAVGPWAVCREVPREVQLLAPSSPLYHLRFCQVLAFTPTTVTFGATSGYGGVFVDGGSVVYGTGFSEPGYVSTGVYFGLPPLLGLGRRYSPAAGRFEELTPLYQAFSGTAKDVPKARPEHIAGQWPRWGRVGYGYGARMLDAPAVRPKDWGAGCLTSGQWPVPLAEAADIAPKPGPPPYPDAPPPAQPLKPLPLVFVAADGQVYKQEAQKWWVLQPGNQWGGAKGPPKDVEFQLALTTQLKPKPRLDLK